MRIAETRVKQYRVAFRLEMSEVRLSHILTERKRTDELTLARIAQAIEDVVAEQAA